MSFGRLYVYRGRLRVFARVSDKRVRCGAGFANEVPRKFDTRRGTKFDTRRGTIKGSNDRVSKIEVLKSCESPHAPRSNGYKNVNNGSLEIDI